MITLTIDQKGTLGGQSFVQPGEAHRYVTERRLISKLMAHLGVDTWVSVLEFQENGWPHWHVLIDKARLPGQRLEYGLVWQWWRNTWGLGIVDCSKKQKGLTRSHALNYITKYLTKFPAKGFPDWVMNALRVRFVSSSKRVGALVKPGQGGADLEAEPQGEDVQTEGLEFEVDGEPFEGSGRREMTNLQAVLGCGWSCNLWRRDYGPDGTAVLRWAGVVQASSLEVMEAIAAREVPVGRMRVILDGGKMRQEMVFPSTTTWRDLAGWMDHWRSLEEWVRDVKLKKRGVERDVETGGLVFT